MQDRLNLFAQSDNIILLDVIDNENKTLDPRNTYLRVIFKDKVGTEHICTLDPEDTANTSNMYAQVNDDGSYSYAAVIPSGTFKANTFLGYTTLSREINENLEDGLQEFVIEECKRSNIFLK